MGVDRDPLAVNKAYWDLRNLRVHRAIPLVVLESKTLLYDIDKDSVSHNASMRWFMRPIDPSEQSLLRNPQLSLDEITRFNDRLGQRTLGEVVYQHYWYCRKLLRRLSRSCCKAADRKCSKRSARQIVPTCLPKAISTGSAAGRRLTMASIASAGGGSKLTHNRSPFSAVRPACAGPSA